MIAGGGTGGHIYPGIAIAKSLVRQDPNVEVHFVGTSSGLEAKIIPREGFPLHLIAGGKLNFSGNPLGKIKTLIKLPIGFIQSFILLLKYRPVAVLGVGGYASGPFVLIAAILGFSTSIWEANVHPGMANRYLSKWVKKCFLVFEESKKYLASKNNFVFGIPVREEMESSIAQSAQAPVVKTQSQDFHLLHYGGSQGSRAIGRTLSAAILENGPWMKDLVVVHQTGSTDHKDFLERYKDIATSGKIEIQEFIFDMKKYYQWADLVLCRGGASTLNEIAAFGLPAIIVPLPAADAHQEHNARVLVEAGAARMILQKDLTVERLKAEIDLLRNAPEQRAQLKQNVRKFYRPQAAEQIAKELLQN